MPMLTSKLQKNLPIRSKKKHLGQDVLTTLNPGQLMVKIVKDELTALMGSEAVGINLSSKPSVILMSGLQGSGKTTLTGKLALHLKQKKINDQCWLLVMSIVLRLLINWE